MADGEGYVVRVRGLPWSCSVDEVQRFFSGKTSILIYKENCLQGLCCYTKDATLLIITIMKPNKPLCMGLLYGFSDPVMHAFEMKRNS